MTRPPRPDKISGKYGKSTKVSKLFPTFIGNTGMGRTLPGGGPGGGASSRMAAQVELSRKGEVMNLSYLDGLGVGTDKDMMQKMLDIGRIVVLSNQEVNPLKKHKTFTVEDLAKLKLAR